MDKILGTTEAWENGELGRDEKFVRVSVENCFNCGIEMNVKDTPQSQNCGGKCLQCLVDTGCQEAAESLRQASLDLFNKYNP